MDELEKAVVEAARLWKKNPERHAALLRKAVERLEAGLCSKTGIGGDPAWPISYRCDLPAHDGNSHKDNVHGEWRSRR